MFATVKVSDQTNPKGLTLWSITPSCFLDPFSQQGAGMWWRAFLTPHSSHKLGKSGAEEKQAWLLYQYKVNAMERVVMVHQFGALGGERARLMVMNVLFGYKCTRRQIRRKPDCSWPQRCSYGRGHTMAAKHFWQHDYTAIHPFSVSELHK